MLTPVINNKKKLRVFRHNATQFNSNGLGILHDANDVRLRTNIDGTRTLEFSLEYKSTSWQLIRHGRLVQSEGQLYRIATYNRKNSGDEPSSVTCFHVFADSAFRTINSFPRGEDSSENTVRNHLVSAFEGSRFHILTEVEVAQLGMQWVTDSIYIDQVGSTSAGEILNTCVTSIEKGELYIDNWNIAVVQRLGRNKGVKISETVNSEATEEESDYSDVITVITVTGKDGLPLPDTYPNSILRAEDSIALYGEREGFLQFDQIEDQVELLDRALFSISPVNANRVDMPKSSLKVSYIDLSKMYKEYPNLGVGDSVFVPTHLSSINFSEARITEIEYYPLSPENSSITIGNPPRTMTDLITAAVRSGQQFDKVVDERGKIKTSWLTNIKNTMRTYVNSRLKELQVELHSTGDVWVDPQNPDRALAIFGGQLAIANSRTPEGDWNWSTFGDGDGFTADLINTGQINTGVVKIADDEGYLNIFSTLIEMYQNSDPNDFTKKRLAMQQGIDPETGQFKYIVWDKHNNPVIYFDSDGELHVKGRVETGATLTTNLYAENGDISLLTVDRLQTSDFVQRYNLKDKSPVKYITADKQWITYILAEILDGSTVHLRNREGQLIYWQEDPNLSTNYVDDKGVLRKENGQRILTTTADTTYPVYIYKYTNTTQMRHGFSDTGVASMTLGKFRVVEITNGVEVSYVGSDGKAKGFRFTETGVTLLNGKSLIEDIRTDSTSQFKLEVLESDPANPQIGRMWLLDN